MGMRFTVLGDGAMGTACATLLATNPSHEVTIWCQFPEQAVAMERDRENKRFLPGVSIPASVRMTADFASLKHVDAFIIAVPTVYLASTVEPLVGRWPGNAAIVSVVKGLEQKTFRSPSQILTDLLGERSIAVLTGPSHAEEIARGLPATVVAASGDLRLARDVQTWFTTDRFRVYTNHDMRGAELAAALKNVIAIAAGICDGLGYGDNAKSALMTRGLVEMVRFGTALGAEAETFFGLAGLGDLITTCTSPHSRNRSVGELMGRGQSLKEVLASRPGVPEGVWTCRSVHELAGQRGLDLPVTAEVYRILYENKSPEQAVADLMSRDPKSER